MRIKGEIVIERPMDEVFDYVCDERHEPMFNPRMRRVELVTHGPIAAGTRFLATTSSMGRMLEMTIEYTAFERPVRLASTTTMPSAQTSGELTFAPDPAGTRLRWTWDVRPTGRARLLAPLIHWMGARQEEAVWTSLKRLLEATQEPAAG